MLKLLIYRSILILFSILPALQVQANGEQDLCSPFEDSAVSGSLIARMLRAADNGHLYRIEPDSSKMGFCVDSSIGRVEGQFLNFNGGIALDGSNQTMVKVELESLKSDGLVVEQMMKGESFFDIDNHPELVFVSSSFEWLSDNRGVLKGELSLRGMTRDVAFYVEILEIEDSPGDTVLVKATTTLHRSEFGMSSLSSMVNEKVNLCMSVEARRYEAS